MSRSSAVIDTPAPEPPERGISHSTAQLLAEGSHWLSTGEVYHDESTRVGKILARLHNLVPSSEYFSWIETPNQELGNKAPYEYFDDEDLKPVEALLDRMEEQSGVSTVSGNAPA